MSRKDYELIARVIAGLDLGEQERIRIARAFAYELLNTNPRFDTARFLGACSRVEA